MRRDIPARELLLHLPLVQSIVVYATVLTDSPPATVAQPRFTWLALAAFTCLWVELASRLRFEWSVNPQYGYGWTVPFLAAFLFWRRWETAPLPAPPRRTLIPVLLILAAGMLLLPVRLVQEANPDWRLPSWSMALAVVLLSLCAIYLAGGRPWLRHFVFPILFFLVAVPWPTQIEQTVIQGLMRADAAINVETLNLIGISAVQLGNVIEVGSGFVGIDEACTGIRSLQATFMVSLFLGEFYGFDAPRRTLLVVAGALLAFGCNLIRTFLLVWLGAEHGSEMIKSWHDPAGMSILMACLFGLWGLSILLRRGKDPELPMPRARTPVPRLPVQVLAIVLASAVLAEAGTQVWYLAHESANARVKPWDVAWPSAASNWKKVPVAESAQELLRYNDGGGGAWRGADGHIWTMYFFRWLPGRTAGLFIKNHRPDVCLPASGMTQHGGVRNAVWSVNGFALPIRSYVFENGGNSLHVFYCYWDGTAVDKPAVDQENWTARGRLAAVRRGKRDIGTQMLELVASGYDDADAAEAAARAQLANIVRGG